MTTYHGITQATCINCGRVTLDALALETMNDLSAECFACGVHFVAWFTEGGFLIVITKEESNGEILRLEIPRNANQSKEISNAN